MVTTHLFRLPCWQRCDNTHLIRYISIMVPFQTPWVWSSFAHGWACCLSLFRSSSIPILVLAPILSKMLPILQVLSLSLLLFAMLVLSLLPFVGLAPLLFPFKVHVPLLLPDAPRVEALVSPSLPPPGVYISLSFRSLVGVPHTKSYVFYSLGV